MLQADMPASTFANAANIISPAILLPFQEVPLQIGAAKAPPKPYHGIGSEDIRGFQDKSSKHGGADT